MGVYSFKELEKLLPAVGSINGMQVKDYLQALQDDNQIRVEKIGSGNWYWSFRSEAKKAKENTIYTLTSEESKLIASLSDAKQRTREEMAKRDKEEEILEGGGVDRKALLQAHGELLKEAKGLDQALAIYSENSPAEVVRKAGEVQRLKDQTIRWTDNIEGLEAFLVNLTSDRAQAASIMQRACGEEYVAGEGLKEL